MSLEMYHFQPLKNSSWHLHHLPLGANTHLRKAISTAHSQLDGSTLNHLFYNLRKHGFQFVFARYLQKNLCIHIKNMFFLIFTTSTPPIKKQTSAFNCSTQIISPPQKKTGCFHRCIAWFPFPAMLPTTNQQAAALGRDGAAWTKFPRMCLDVVWG